MKATEVRKLERRRGRIERRLARRNFSDQPRPMFRSSNVVYEVAERANAVVPGGIGAVHVLARRVGLVREIDESLHLLKVHAPYHESDHVLNVAYNMMAGNTRLEDLELLRRNESYMDSLGAERIPDPTTAGDFLRRFSAQDVIALMEVVNRIRVGVWKRQPRAVRKLAILDADGTVVPTDGEKKEGMGLSYNGIWGYHPLLVSLANWKEPLFVVNRSGNATSHDEAAQWIDRAIDLVLQAFDEVLVRGDTDFSLTTKFDGWTGRGVRFVFGYDARGNLKETADSLPDTAWRRLERRPRYDVKTRPRRRRGSVKERIVREKEYENVRLRCEDVAEFPYRPVKCSREYRMVVVRKNLTREKGETRLFDEVRYFFYVTNDFTMPAEEVVGHAGARCDQENLIEQLKNGVNALRVPMYDLVSNWAYMVAASLAWTLKAWMALVQPREADRDDLIGMEFKRFVKSVMLVPCQVVRTARRVILRVLGWTDRIRVLFETVAAARRLADAGVT